MLKAEVLALIGRVRRAMPRNVDVMALCEELERAVTNTFVTVTKRSATKKLGRPPLGDRTMTGAERQRRVRARDRW